MNINKTNKALQPDEQFMLILIFFAAVVAVAAAVSCRSQYLDGFGSGFIP